ncbi:MAG: hypothetical protein HYY18_15395 [Planctomycetes bacterium]|nr:hypothetical protein [Planctomycetota bacterium]
MNFAKRAVLTVAIACAGLTEAEEPEAPEPVAVVPHAWHGFESGTWVERRFDLKRAGVRTVRTTRTTLVGEEDSLLRLEIQAVEGTGADRRLAGNAERDFAIDTVLKADRFRPAGEEAVDVGGKEFRCRVWETPPPAAGAEQTEPTTKIWHSSEVSAWGGIVKWETETPGDGKRSKEREHVIVRLVELDREATVCGEKVRCAVRKTLQSFDDETATYEIEELISNAIPGGIVSRRGKGRFRDGGELVETESVEELVGLHFPRKD